MPCNMYKTETHLHVSEVSACSRLSAEEMVKLYFEAGYRTIFVSDHFKQNYFDSLGDIAWEEKIKNFLSGYRKAKALASQYGMHVLLAAEVTLVPNHYLLYGVTEEFLCKFPALYNMEKDRFYEAAKEHGIFVVQAHPFRDGKCVPTPQYADGFEIYNSNPRHNDFNDKAENIAKENGLYITAGSDAHRLEDIAGSGILTEVEIKTTEDFVNVIKGGAFQIIRG